MPRSFSFTEAQTSEMVALYNKGWGCREVSRHTSFHCTEGQVQYALKKNGLTFRSETFGSGRPQRSLPISSDTLHLIEGMLLGDGCMVGTKPPHVNSGFAMCISAKHIDFAEWVKTNLETDSISVGLKIGNNGSNTGRLAAKLHTIRTKEFTALRNLWYPGDKKLIPHDLQLFPETLLAWYMSDGTLHRKGKSGGVTLYTNGFTFSDVEFLRELLKGIGIQANLKTQHGTPSFSKKEGNWPVLYVPFGFEGRNINKFFAFMGDCPVPSLLYKWPGQ